MTEPKEVTKLRGEEYDRVRLRKRPSHPQKTKRQKDKKTGPFFINDFKKTHKKNTTFMRIATVTITKKEKIDVRK